MLVLLPGQYPEGSSSSPPIRPLESIHITFDVFNRFLQSMYMESLDPGHHDTGILCSARTSRLEYDGIRLLFGENRPPTTGSNPVAVG